MKINKAKYTWILVLVLGLTLHPMVQGQQGQDPVITVNARVVDDAGNPVAGVLVSSFTYQKTAVTANDGTFSLAIAREARDQIVLDVDGYAVKIVNTADGKLEEKELVLEKESVFNGGNILGLPYEEFTADQNVSNIDVISGEELLSYPSATFLQSLAGRFPGLIIQTSDMTPGQEVEFAYIRGEEASVYIDGILRDPSDLSVNEVDRVQIIKDLSGRAALGISGANPIIWITTKKGIAYKREITVRAEKGISSPTALPEYLDAYQYASLYNEALQNDGLPPLYSQEALDAYRDGTDPLFYPNIDYYGKYVKPSTSYQRANVSFNGGDDRINYFSMLDYVGSGGLEAVGEETRFDRYKIRGNLNVKLNDFIQMNVNLSGTYGKTRFPNDGDGPYLFNMFDVLSSYPSNAHAMSYNDTLLISDNYPVNMDNSLMYNGHAEGVVLNSQNTVNLLVDLDDLLEGLTFTSTISFDVYSNIINNIGGTEALYRLLSDGSYDLITEKVVDTEMKQWYDNFMRRTLGYMVLNYRRTFDRHKLFMNLSYYQGQEEQRSLYAGYQPLKMQDLTYRANYLYDNKYALQFDLAYSGSMKLPAGERFGLFPTLGASWVLSNEAFMENITAVDYLKFSASLGKTGVNTFTLGNYNTYYLFETLWQNVGSWTTGNTASSPETVNIYRILQEGSLDYKLPKRNYFNAGIQGELFDRALAIELNYFYQKDYDKLSFLSNGIPTIYGSGGFLPATNYGESTRYGVDGMIRFSKSTGDFRYSIGANAMYLRGKNLVVDEPAALEDYRKTAGKDSDLLWLYQAEGLFQDQTEIDNNTVNQIWGTLKPGDIRYFDYNDDGKIDEKDRFSGDAHTPRLYYGLNLNFQYRGLGLMIIGQGVADGDMLLSSPRYFWINSTYQNYSEVMLDRWPESNNYPRLTTLSDNNYQYSTFWLTSAAYFRLKNVQLSYTLPVSVSQRFLVKEMKIFVNGANLLVFSGVNKYKLDPENMYAGSYMYPMLKTMTAGISCKF